MNYRKFYLVLIVLLIIVFAVFSFASAEGIQIPSGVNRIEEEAFAGIKASCVSIPSSVETISSRAFASCTSLTDVYLPFQRLNIADDAFDTREITFHVYFGSDNEIWAKQHGYSIAYISNESGTSSNPWGQVNDLIANEAISTTADNPYYTHRLIVKTETGYDLPALDHYNPKTIVSIGENRHVIQFENDTDASTCANALKSWSGIDYVNIDYFLSSADSASGNSTPRSRALRSNGINASDPMGFSAYVNYLGSDVGSVTIAVIDSGVNADQVACNVSDKSYDFINNRTNAVSGFTSHGTLVAQTMCEAFGNLSGHLTIISYRIENPANSRISYIQMGEAILQAKADGADFVNISIAGESPYSTFQDNEFLRECINAFGAGKVIAAGGNSATSVANYIPAKYCTSVTGVKLENGEFSRASGTALYADYGGFATTTSVAAPKITASLALVKLDPNPTHTFSKALINDNASQNGMPNLEKLAIQLVERISFADYSNNDTIILEVGDPLSIQYSVYPSDATVSTVTPISNDNNILKYKSHTATHARFTANAPGTAEIIFTSDDGNAEARLKVQVIQPLASITISGGTDELLYKDESIALSALALPTDATNQTIMWTSSNESIARISTISEDTKSCVITQVGSGDVVITATAQANSEATDSVVLHFTDVSSPSSVTIVPTGGINTIYNGKTAGSVQMIAQVYPADADQTVEWFSSNTSVATIDINSGLVTAVGPGMTIITARAVTGNASGIYDCITVVQLPTSITVSGTTSIIVGNTTTLNASVQPDNTNDKSINWISSNTDVATVSSTGVVTGVSDGTALISAISVADGTVAGSCYVTVSPATYTVTFDANSGYCSTSTKQVTLGETYGDLPTPSRTGYGFTGWYTPDDSKVLDSTIVTTASNHVLYAHWNAIAYTVNYDANGGNVDPTSKTVTYDSTYGDLATPTRTGWRFDGWFTAASGGVQVTNNTKVITSSNHTLYAHWTANSYTYSIVYESSNGTSLGLTTMTKTYGSSATVTPPAYAGYTTPSAQTVNWDSSSKTVTFTYSPVSATVTSIKNVHFATYNSGEETYSAEITVGERTATSVKIKIKVTFRLPAGAYNTYAHKLTGKIDDTSIPKTTIVSLNKWKSASSSVRTESSTTSWITVPVTATQTTVNAKLILRLYNSSDSYMSSLASSEKNVTVNIPGY